MTNLSTTPKSDKPISPNPDGAARDYLCGEVRELAHGLHIQLDILDGYAELRQSEMVVFAAKQVLTTVRMLREIAKRIDALNQGGAS